MRWNFSQTLLDPAVDIDLKEQIDSFVDTSRQSSLLSDAKDNEEQAEASTTRKEREHGGYLAD